MDAEPEHKGEPLEANAALLVSPALGGLDVSRVLCAGAPRKRSIAQLQKAEGDERNLDKKILFGANGGGREGRSKTFLRGQTM